MTAPAAVGVDLGGTKLLAVVMVGDEVAASVSRPTGRTIGVEGVARLLDEVLDALAASSGLSMDDCQLAVGFPGLVDGASGRVRRSVILDGWDGVDVADALSDDTRRVVGVANDVHRAAAGEVWFRRRRGETVGDLMCITVGTGIGGAIVIDGQVWPGGSGWPERSVTCTQAVTSGVTAVPGCAHLWRAAGRSRAGSGRHRARWAHCSRVGIRWPGARRWWLLIGSGRCWRAPCTCSTCRWSPSAGARVLARVRAGRGGVVRAVGDAAGVGDLSGGAARRRAGGRCDRRRTRGP